MANIMKVLSNTRTRTLIMFAGVILIAGIFLAFMSFREQEDPLKDRKSRASSVPVNVESTPGAKTSAKYQELQTKSNIRGTKEAESSGKSFIPTIVGDVSDDSNLFDIFAKEEEPEEKKAEPQRDPRITKMLEDQQRMRDQQLRLERERQRELDAQRLAELQEARLKTIEKVAGAMKTQAEAATKAWTTFDKQEYQSGKWAQLDDEATGAFSNMPIHANLDSNGNSNGSRSGSNGGSGTDADETGELIMKAGEIVFAVLETAVNSDEPGPVMVRIVSGPYKNSKLIGEIKENKNKFTQALTLTFNVMNVPSEPESFKVDAVAIDPQTARTALASDVDHHYLSRYGSLFASAFLEGYSKAVAKSQESGSTTVNSATGSTTTTSNKPALTGKEQLFEGLGEVGSAWGKALGENFDRKPTISIEQGLGVGILFTKDVVLGTPFDTDNNQQLGSTSPGDLLGGGTLGGGATTTEILSTITGGLGDAQ